MFSRRMNNFHISQPSLFLSRIKSVKKSDANLTCTSGGKIYVVSVILCIISLQTIPDLIISKRLLIHC